MHAKYHQSIVTGNDHPDVAVRCPFLKKHRACEQNADKMKKLCSLTCGFC